MREVSKLTAAAACAGAGLWVLVGAALAQSALKGPTPGDVVFAPHRAVYDLSLDETNSGSGVAGVSGRIVYELTGSSCEGYAQSMRFVTQTMTQEGDTQVTDLRTSSWEQVPPRRLRFSTSTYQNEQPADQTQGVAERENPTGATRVDLTRPAKRKIDLSGTVYFPIQHSMAIVKAARSGTHILAADLFDGSETGDKIYSTSTVIGRQIPPGKGNALSLSSGSAKLDDVPSWPVSVSYFTPGRDRADTLPLYEMSYRFHDNGVTSSLRIDHGEFAIKGELKELTYLDAGKCPPAKP
jgi:envelope integrity protein B